MWPSLSSPLLWLVIPRPSCPPLSSAGCPPTEGLHPPSDPWGTARSMVQPGYTTMLGNPPHLSQHAPFTAINPQDRLVSCAFILWFILLVFLWRHYEVFDTCWLMHHWGLLFAHAFKWLGVFVFQKRQPLPLSPQNYPMHGGEVNGAHPAGFHSGPSSFGVPSHTPPMADPIMGKPFCVKSASCFPPLLSHCLVFVEHRISFQYFFPSPKANRGTVPGSSGDEIGKALASVSYNKICTHGKAVFLDQNSCKGIRWHVI